MEWHALVLRSSTHSRTLAGATRAKSASSRMQWHVEHLREISVIWVTKLISVISGDTSTRARLAGCNLQDAMARGAPARSVRKMGRNIKEYERDISVIWGVFSRMQWHVEHLRVEISGIFFIFYFYFLLIYITGAPATGAPACSNIRNMSWLNRSNVYE